MLLTPWEEERLLIFSAAELARRQRAAGLALNAPEAVALICDAMLQAARAGASYAQVEEAGRAAVAPGDVLPGVRELVPDVRLEVLLEDGSRLIVLLDPIAAAAAPEATAAPGGGPDAPAGGGAGASGSAGSRETRPGAIELAASEAADPTADLDRVTLDVLNTSRRVVRVSSHFPFDRVNRRLEFDRAAAAGRRLDLPAGSDERWAPGESRSVTLVRYRGQAGRA